MVARNYETVGGGNFASEEMSVRARHLALLTMGCVMRVFALENAFRGEMDYNLTDDWLEASFIAKWAMMEFCSVLIFEKELATAFRNRHGDDRVRKEFVDAIDQAFEKVYKRAFGDTIAFPEWSREEVLSRYRKVYCNENLNPHQRMPENIMVSLLHEIDPFITITRQSVIGKLLYCEVAQQAFWNSFVHLSLDEVVEQNRRFNEIFGREVPNARDRRPAAGYLGKDRVVPDPHRRLIEQFGVTRTRNWADIQKVSLNKSKKRLESSEVPLRARHLALSLEFYTSHIFALEHLFDSRAGAGLSDRVTREKFLCKARYMQYHAMYFYSKKIAKRYGDVLSSIPGGMEIKTAFIGVFAELFGPKREDKELLAKVWDLVVDHRIKLDEYFLTGGGEVKPVTLADGEKVFLKQLRAAVGESRGRIREKLLGKHMYARFAKEATALSFFYLSKEEVESQVARLEKEASKVADRIARETKDLSPQVVREPLVRHDTILGVYFEDEE